VTKIKLSTTATLLKCPVCDKFKLISKGVHKIEAAINDSDKSNCQSKISLHAYYIVICDDCYQEIFKEKGMKKRNKI